MFLPHTQPHSSNSHRSSVGRHERMDPLRLLRALGWMLCSADWVASRLLNKGITSLPLKDVVSTEQSSFRNYFDKIFQVCVIAIKGREGEGERGGGRTWIPTWVEKLSFIRRRRRHCSSLLNTPQRLNRFLYSPGQPQQSPTLGVGFYHWPICNLLVFLLEIKRPFNL